MQLATGFLVMILASLEAICLSISLERCRQNRRGFLHNTAMVGTSAVASNILLPLSAFSEEPQVEAYFGCGCFWHVQHEFVEAERRILGRNDSELTSRAGYAGGLGGAKNGKVCYHNPAHISDYASLGHAEVVRIRVPAASFPSFCIEYCNLFSSKGYRPDQWGDFGSEYRNLVGVPGGVSSQYSQQLIAASQSAGDKLDFAAGNGNDLDLRGLCFIMDSASFPFYTAEQYHQFHDGFNLGENYSSSYNRLADKRQAGQRRQS